MATVVPQSDLMKRAITWLSEAIEKKGTFAAVIDEASMRFNLSPKDVEFLKKFFTEKLEGKD